MEIRQTICPQEKLRRTFEMTQPNWDWTVAPSCYRVWSASQILWPSRQVWLLKLWEKPFILVYIVRRRRCWKKSYWRCWAPLNPVWLRFYILSFPANFNKLLAYLVLSATNNFRRIRSLVFCLNSLCFRFCFTCGKGQGCCVSFSCCCVSGTFVVSEVIVTCLREVELVFEL